MGKRITLWQIREFAQDAKMGLSKPLGVRLRSAERATRLVQRLRSSGREAFAVPFKIHK